MPIAKALEPYGVTIHSLRKTYAYFLKSNNVHVTTAAKFMGHSNPLVTLKIYTLVRDDEINLVGDELRRVLTTDLVHLRDTNDMSTHSHPNELIIPVSNNLRGVPSGFELSHWISPSKPTTWAISTARSAIEISRPQPTLIGASSS